MLPLVTPPLPLAAALALCLAEGCGSRGLFVKTSAGAFVITSRVAVAPGP